MNERQGREPYGESARRSTLICVRERGTRRKKGRGREKERERERERERVKGRKKDQRAEEHATAD